MPVKPQVVTAGEDGPVSSPGKAVSGEGTSESCGSDTDTAILPQTQAATSDDKLSSESESFDAAPCGHLSQAIQYHYGRQRRPPHRYGDWV